MTLASGGCFIVWQTFDVDLYGSDPVTCLTWQGLSIGVNSLLSRPLCYLSPLILVPLFDIELYIARIRLLEYVNFELPSIAEQRKLSLSQLIT